MMKTFFRAAVLSVLFALFPAAWAQQNVRSSGSTIYLNEVPVISLYASYGGRGPSARAAAVVAALKKAASIDQIEVKKQRQGHRLYIGKVEVLASKGDAKGAGTSTEGLAARWVKALREARSLPDVRLDTTLLTLPVGGTKKISMVGRFARNGAIAISDPNCASVEQKDATLQVRALALGDVTVTITAGTTIESLRIKVQPYASTFPQSAGVEVTGSPTQSKLVAEAIEGAVRTQISTQPAASMEIVVPKLAPMASGQTKTVDVQVKVSAPESLPASGTVQVVVRNVGLRSEPEQVLWYCNDPESVKEPASLFAAVLEEDKAARMLYHHVNDSAYPMLFGVMLLNDSDSPARVAVIPGNAPTDKNPVAAGFEAGSEFVSNWVTQSGEVVTVPARGTVTVSFRKFLPRQTVSGLVYLRLLPGGPTSLNVRADAVPWFNLDERRSKAVTMTAPWRALGTEAYSVGLSPSVASTVHEYPNPFRNLELNYEVGGRFAFLRMGQSAIASVDQQRTLSGNFGVVYQIETKLQNKTATATIVEIVFEASAGYTGAIFMVNDQIVKTPLLQPKAQYRILKLRLDPGQERVFSLMTMPLSGGSYPATIIARPLDTLAPEPGAKRIGYQHP